MYSKSQKICSASRTQDLEYATHVYREGVRKEYDFVLLV